jgi:hypothetical protein
VASYVRNTPKAYGKFKRRPGYRTITLAHTIRKKPCAERLLEPPIANVSIFAVVARLIKSALWEAGDQIGALRIAARFFDRSADTKTFKRGMGAYNNPDFYRQLGPHYRKISRYRALEDAAGAHCSRDEWRSGECGVHAHGWACVISPWMCEALHTLTSSYRASTRHAGCEMGCNQLMTWRQACPCWGSQK